MSSYISETVQDSAEVTI